MAHSTVSILQGRTKLGKFGVEIYIYFKMRSSFFFFFLDDITNEMFLWLYPKAKPNIKNICFLKGLLPTHTPIYIFMTPMQKEPFI